MRIILFGGGGYVGSAIYKEILRSDHHVIEGDWNDDLDYQFSIHHPDAAVNAAAFITQPRITDAENHKSETIQGNVVFPAQLAEVCQHRSVPLLHLSTGCLWQGRDIPHHEEEKPELTFENPKSWFYTATKVEAERALAVYERVWICRIRLLFDEFESPRNLLSKLMLFRDVYEYGVPQSLTHRRDLAETVVKMIMQRVPYGTYHCTNPGSATYTEICGLLKNSIAKDKRFNLVNPTPASRDSFCSLSTEKLECCGVAPRPLLAALGDAVDNWSMKPNV